jgi:hypothetical protein
MSWYMTYFMNVRQNPLRKKSPSDKIPFGQNPLHVFLYTWTLSLRWVDIIPFMCESGQNPLNKIAT